MARKAVITIVYDMDTQEIHTRGTMEPFDLYFHMMTASIKSVVEYNMKPKILVPRGQAKC